MIVDFTREESSALHKAVHYRLAQLRQEHSDPALNEYAQAQTAALLSASTKLNII